MIQRFESVVPLPDPESYMPAPDVMSVDCWPGMNEQLEAFCSKPVAAIVILGYACGTTPEIINPSIKRITDKDIPVFIVSGEWIPDGSIENLTYPSQISAVEAGATPLKNANRSLVGEVRESIQILYDEGVMGDDLAHLVVAHYGSPIKTQNAT